ncbi:GmrSD restriction endonuclease domain-containing protein [Nocardia macrotermitis]|uniref:GmrSD restriction endonucleases N-terminal domain-containing protein n=1 Tax=Nocardia macrotermitis TaxID=2585198 RepID=A0A7K0DGM4_9NOCA|nr:DUF262 domain-containing protein [Nocardia macrotermitis]MQY24442.1 hypothetical protein [Nocardia macrotermitis]
MALDSPKLHTVLEQIRSGAMQLPDFQRDWKWDDQRIRELIATVTLDYPLGVVMTLETGGKSQFRARPLTGSESTGPIDPDLLLLDGQQRLTSLFQSLYRDEPVLTSDARGKALERWYYIDIQRAIVSGGDRDESIISVPPDRFYRDKSKRPTIELDLGDTAAECRAKHFPLHIVFDADRVNAWMREFVTNVTDGWQLWAGFDPILHNIRSFLIPMIRLEAATTPDAVCSVFERVNTNGVPLNVFELLTATYAGNRDYETEHADYYRLPEVWQDIKKDLATSYPVLGQLDAGIDHGLSSSDFLQAVTLAYTWERKQAGLTASVSCKRRDLLNLPLTAFDRIAPQLRDSFAWVGEFLTRQCIVHSDDLPYRPQLLPLAVAHTIVGEAVDDPGAEARISRWFWCGVLGEMYSGSTESRLSRDVEQLVEWIRADGPIPDTVAEAIFLNDRLDTLSTRNSAAYKGIYALLVKQGAIDWYYNQEPMTAGSLLQNAVDIRQVFPKNWCSRNNIPTSRANSIVNKTMLSNRASRSIVGAPSSYLPVLASESGTRDEWFDDFIATHLIDPATLRTDDFHGFYADRSRQLVGLVTDAMGKDTLFRAPTER